MDANFLEQFYNKDAQYRALKKETDFIKQEIVDIMGEKRCMVLEDDKYILKANYSHTMSQEFLEYLKEKGYHEHIKVKESTTVAAFNKVDQIEGFTDDERKRFQIYKKKPSIKISKK